MSGELNKQLQQLDARLRQAQNSIIAHHQALSIIVDKLLTNPYTVDVGMVGKIFYDHLPFSFQALCDLVGSGIPDFSNLMDTMAESLVNAAEEAVDDVIAGVGQLIEAQIALLEAAITTLIDQITTLAAAILELEDLLLTLIPGSDEYNQVVEQINQKTAEKSILEANKLSKETALEKFGDILSKGYDDITDFFTGQSRLRQGKSSSVKLNNTQP